MQTKEYLDKKIEEHRHIGTDAKKIAYTILNDRPINALTTTITEDVSLGTSKLTGGTLISGQTEVAVAAGDKLILSDASDSGNLKYIERADLGSMYITASNTEYYESVASSTDDRYFTIPFPGVFRLTFAVAQVDNPGDDFQARLKYANTATNTYANCYTTTGTECNATGTGTLSVSWDVYTTTNIKFMLDLGSNTRVYNFYIKYTKAVYNGVITH